MDSVGKVNELMKQIKLIRKSWLTTSDIGITEAREYFKIPRLSKNGRDV